MTIGVSDRQPDRREEALAQRRVVGRHLGDVDQGAPGLGGVAVAAGPLGGELERAEQGQQEEGDREQRSTPQRNTVCRRR